MEDYKIVDEDYNFNEIKVGDVLTGIVTEVEQNKITLNVNSYVEATMYLNAYANAGLESFVGLVNVGDEIKGKVMKISNDEYQYILLSRLPLLEKENFNKLIEAYKNSANIKAKIVKTNSKGYVLRSNGIELFMPFGQLTLEDETEDAKINAIGNEIDVRITDMDEKKKRFIASRKVILKETLNETKAKEYDSINVNDVIKGEVIRLEPYGAFIKFGANQALLRISNISYHHVNNIREVIAMGEEIEVKIIKKENGKLECSRKALLKTPFEDYCSKHTKGEKVVGKVINKLPFGILLELEEDVVGLLHQSEFAWNPKDNFADYIKIGQEFEVAIKGFDNKKQNISLSKKALEDNPWSRVNVNKGDTVEAEIINIIPGKGVDVTTCGIETFIPLVELSKEKITKIEDTYTLGEKLEAIVIDVFTDRWEMKLSVKKFEEIKEKKQFEEYMNKEQENVSSITLGDRFKDLLKK